MVQHLQFTPEVEAMNGPQLLAYCNAARADLTNRIHAFEEKRETATDAEQISYASAAITEFTGWLKVLDCLQNDIVADFAHDFTENA